MKFSKWRVLIPTVIFIVLAIGLICGVSFGTLSGFGWEQISALCPLGAFTTMISTKTLVPRAIVSIVVMALLVFLVGRAFCAYICPVNVIEQVKNFFRSPKKRKELEKKKHDEIIEIAHAELGCGHNCSSCGSACGQKRPKFDGRHGVLVGALLSSAVFGFPVFCLICPVGLTFAAVLLTWRLFAFGDTTLAIVFVFGMLIIELFVLRKWCIRFCPLAALMNLVSRFSKTTKPVINDEVCLETTTGKACSRCAMACDHGINLRHLAAGEHDLADCTRCYACVEACPTKAISMPFVTPKTKAPVFAAGAGAGAAATAGSANASIKEMAAAVQEKGEE